MSRMKMKGGLVLCCIPVLIFGVDSVTLLARVNSFDSEEPLLGCGALAPPSGFSSPTREEVPLCCVCFECQGAVGDFFLEEWPFPCKHTEKLCAGCWEEMKTLPEVSRDGRRVKCPLCRAYSLPLPGLPRAKRVKMGCMQYGPKVVSCAIVLSLANFARIRNPQFFGNDCSAFKWCSRGRWCKDEVSGNTSIAATGSATCQPSLSTGSPCNDARSCLTGVCGDLNKDDAHREFLARKKFISTQKCLRCGVCVGACNPSPSGCCIDGIDFGQTACHERNCHKTGGCCDKSTGDKRMHGGYCSDVPEVILW